MRMLLMPPYFFPERVASTHLDEDRFFCYMNNNIQTIVYAPTPTRGVTVDDINNTKMEEYLYERTVFVKRFHMYHEGKNPIMRAFRYMLVNVRQYLLGIRTLNVDIIFSGSTPPTQGILCGLVKKKLCRKYKKNVPYVLCLQDIFPDSLVNARMTQKGSFLWRVGRIIEDFSYRNADKIIVISEDFKRNIMKKGVLEEKIIVIPNWVNTNNVFPVSRENNMLFEKYCLDYSKFYVCYSGNLGHSQNLSLLVTVAEKIRHEMPEVVFILIGEGVAKKEIEEKVKEKELTNIIILPFQPYEKIAHVFSLGDVGLIISKAGIGENSVPSKTWGIMAAQKPVVASFDKNSSLASLLERTKSGIVADADDEYALIDAIKRLKDDKQLRIELGKNGYKYVHTELNKDSCTQKYVEVIKSCVGE